MQLVVVSKVAAGARCCLFREQPSQKDVVRPMETFCYGQRGRLDVWAVGAAGRRPLPQTVLIHLLDSANQDQSTNYQEFFKKLRERFKHVSACTKETRISEDDAVIWIKQK